MGFGNGTSSTPGMGAYCKTSCESEENTRAVGFTGSASSSTVVTSSLDAMSPEVSQACGVSNHTCSSVQADIDVTLDDTVMLSFSSLDSVHLLNLEFIWHVETMHLAGNKLTAVPEGIEMGRWCLTDLNMSSNRLATLPPCIGCLKNLLFLNVSCNQLQTVPPEIAFLQCLKELNLQRQEPSLQNLPQQCQFLPVSLRLLVQGNTNLIEPPLALFQQVGQTTLDLFQFGGDIPFQLNGFCTSDAHDLSVLSDSSNSSFDPEERLIANEVQQLCHIYCIPKLREFFKGSTVSTKSMEIKIDPYSEQFVTKNGMGITNVQVVPPDAVCASRIMILNLEHNRICSINNSIGRLVSLVSLRLGWNQLKSIPESICNLFFLIQLELNDNILFALPDGLGQLQRLHFLGFAHNQSLLQLPIGICNLSEECVIDAFGCKVVVPPIEVLQRGEPKQDGYLCVPHISLYFLENSSDFSKID